MLSLAWLTVFIIFVYVPGSTLNVIERSSSSLLLLSKSDSEATKLDKSSVALVGSSSLSLMPGDDDYAKEKLIFRRTNNNKTEEGEIIELNDITAASAPITRNTTTTTILGGKYHHHQQQHQHQEHQRESLKKEQVSDNAHSVITKDPSASSPSSLLLSSSSLLNIELTQATTSTTDTPTTTTISARTTTTTTKTPPPPTETTAIRTWNNLNDFGNSKNNNGRRSSKSIYGQHEPTPTPTPQPPLLPPPAAQQQNRQHLQLALLSASSSLSSSSSGGTHQQSLLNPIPVAILRNTTTVLPLQLTQSIQNTASVIIRGNSLNWGYVELASSDSPSTSSPPFSISSSTPRTAELPGAVVVPTQLPHQLSSTTSSAAGSSFVLSLSPGSSSFLYSSELPLMSSSSSTLASSLSSLSPLSPTTTSLSSSMSSLSTTSTARTTTSTTTPKSPSLSSTDGYLNITSQAGTHAYLPCNVKQLVKKPISWLRVRDGHILTVDQTTFIADQRFQSIYTPNPERWSLQIKYVQTKDAGTYECQVSTEPKTSAIVSLNIVEPKTELIGESNRHVKAGSQVKLRCIISQALEPPLYINWYHNRQQIFLHNRKGWRTEIERDVAVSGTTATGSSSSSSSSLSSSNSNNNNNISQDKQSTTIASLIIPSVGKKDSGNYTCSPSNSEPITVVLHVLNGEYSASAITSGSARSNSIKDIQGLLHLIPWVISLVMCFGQMIYFYDVSRLLLPLSSSQLRRRTTSLTAERN
ncbi:uncharacterized protein LOC129919855 isoform X2 [Episyrphus balteatus]|uniref:uncharacterized protein LOC129919855 isoform X2 n=1 Tax=Episyrphus balteatus TaxID=286459 RepID=UPI0024852F25|nr:uncharacterized protein LOC129919855 isoform X2 [Episyrphus balteatus]